MSKPTIKASNATTGLHLRTPPGPHGHPLFGMTFEAQRDPLGFLVNLTQQFGDVVRMRFIFWPIYVVTHPEDVKHVLQDNNRNYSKDHFAYKAVRLFLGQGLITNDGSSWLRQRRLMQPAFHRQRLADFGTLMSNATITMLEGWQALAEHEQPLNIANEMIRLSLRIAGQALFSIDLSKETDALGLAFKKMSTMLADNFYAPPLPISIPTRRNRQVQATRRSLDTIVYSIISERRQLSMQTGDLLSILMNTRDEETGEMMNDSQLRDEVITLLFAGHETTANVLTWTWYLLSQHPEVEQRLHAELDEVLNGGVPTIEHLPKLTYSRMVLEEAMRLYPPVWVIGRKALADDELGGYHIPANSLVVLSPYLTHHHSGFWEQPEIFNPERFSPESVANRPRYAYFPFIGGPRLCIGNHFAMMEAQLVLATIAQRYQLRLAPGYKVEPEALVTLRPRNGLLMKLHGI